MYAFSIKYLICFFLLFSFVALSKASFAGIVSKATADKVAVNFLTVQGNSSLIKSAGSELACRTYGRLHLTNDSDSDYPAFYIYNSAEPGFVIVSGTDAISPILACSGDNHFDFSYMSPGLEALLKDYETEIKYVILKGLEPTPQVKSEWASLLFDRGVMKSAVLIDSVRPLTTTKWGYGKPYNDLCPADPRGTVRNGFRAPAGCAAIAMAQILKYWNKPIKGIGKNTYATSYGDLYANFGLTLYDWKNMPDVLEDSSPDFQKKAVSTLIYHCGISVNMDYNYNFSGSYFICEPEPYSYLNCVLKAFTKYFGFKNTIVGEKFNSSDAKWKEKIRQELLAGRPVLYAGEDTRYNSAHALVIDGFDKEDLFYMNWGLYGFNNGKYRLNLLELPVTETATYNFTENALIITGIQPDQTVGTVYPEMEEEISIWPNPATDRLYIDLSLLRDRHANLEILNYLGMKISEIQDTGSQTTIPLGKLKPGVYFFRVNTGEKAIVKKFIIR